MNQDICLRAEKETNMNESSNTQKEKKKLDGTT